MKRVAIIADYVTPCEVGTTAAKRIDGLARYLPDYSWHPTIIARQCTCRPGDRSRKNEFVIKTGQEGFELPLHHRQSTMVRVECSPNFYYRQWIQAASTLKNIPPPEEHPYYPLYHTCFNWEANCHDSKRRGKLTSQIRQKISALAITLQRDCTDWFNRGVDIVEKLHDQENFHAVLSSAPPAINHLIAAEVARRTGLPLILDFRDVLYRGWSRDFITGFSQWCAMRQVRRKSRQAHSCIFVTPGEQKRGARQILLNESHVIPNGFFFEDIQAAKESEIDHDSETFAIRLLGTVYPEQGLEIFIQGFNQFLQQLKVADAKRVRFEYFGPSWEAVQNACQARPCTSNCSFHSSVSQREAISLTISASMLVLLTTTNGQSGIPGAKFYEYLASGRPILAAGNDVEVSSEIDRLGAGEEAKNSSQVSKYLLHSFYKWQNEEPLSGVTNTKLLEPYTRRNGVAKLARLLSGSAL